MSMKKMRNWTCLSTLLLSLGLFAGNAYAEVERPDLTEFEWFFDELDTLGAPEVPENAFFIDGYEEVVGDWKCMILTAETDYLTDGVVVLCNATITGDWQYGEFICDWYERVFMENVDIYDESGEADSVFRGSATGEGLYYIGAGNVLLTNFYELDGTQYGFGTFKYPSGEEGQIALMRGAAADAQVNVDETTVVDNSQINVDQTTVVDNSQINVDQTTVVDNSQINVDQTTVVDNSQVNINQTTVINNSQTNIYQTNVSIENTLVQYFITYVGEFKDSLQTFFEAYFYEAGPEWETLPRHGFFDENPDYLFTRYSGYSFGYREFEPMFDDVPYALLVNADVDFALIPMDADDAVLLEDGLFYPVTTGSRFILEVYNNADEAAKEAGECSYDAVAIYAPEEPVSEVVDGTLQVTFPEGSFTINKGITGGYRLTIISADGKTTEKFYKASAAGKVKEYDLADISNTVSDQNTYQVSICEFIEDENGERYFGPESGEGANLTSENGEVTEETILLDERLEEEGAITGDITVSMIWESTDDMDLHLETPEGHIWYSNKTTEHGELDVDMQTNSNMVEHPIENIYVNDPPRGEYKVWVRKYADRTDGDTEVTVRVTVNGHQNVYTTVVNEDVDIVTFTL